MKNTQDNEFHSIKKQLAEKNKELTEQVLDIPDEDED